LRVVYFVHDLNDPAVTKRVLMLRTSGLDVVVAGFWRGSSAPLRLAGADALSLGRTFDAQLVHRGLVTFQQALKPRWPRDLASGDVFLARSLQMLAIAVAAKRSTSGTPAIVYECVDVHRLLLSAGPAGIALRALERALLNRVDLLLVSSPAFLREYFSPLQLRGRTLPSALLENKLFGFQSDAAQPTQLESGPPWRIGWFGMLRCRRSFEILSSLARRRPDLVQVELAGRPARSVFANFEQLVESAAGLHFAGTYGPGDLQQLYSGVHFNWAIDYFEEDGNSRWLLPNRIYEGGSYDCVPLSLRKTETGRWLESKGLGVRLDCPEVELEKFLGDLTPTGYQLLKSAASRAPRSTFIADQSECDRLVSILRDAAAVRYFPAPRDSSFRLSPGQMDDDAIDIDVCVCSFRRPGVVNTLKALSAQAGINKGRLRVIVADNTAHAEAKAVVLATAKELELQLHYVHAPANNISIARNACLDAASAPWVAFIDDDEVPTAVWLESLLAEAQNGGWDAVLGPVDAVYPAEAPRWMRHGSFHSTRPVWRHGKIATGYTGNVLFRRDLVELRQLRFRPDLGAAGGEDEEFFYRFSDAGGRIGYAPRAVVHERVALSRASVAWLIRRSFRCGQTHAARLRHQRSILANVLLAFAKAGTCMAGAAVSAANSIRRTRYLIRAALHCGAVAKLLGMREIRMY
jgi:glycosyltransferase involved in cell wall biosynthesis